MNLHTISFRYKSNWNGVSTPIERSRKNYLFKRERRNGPSSIAIRLCVMSIPILCWWLSESQKCRYVCSIYTFYVTGNQKLWWLIMCAHMEMFPFYFIPCKQFWMLWKSFVAFGVSLFWNCLFVMLTFKSIWHFLVFFLSFYATSDRLFVAFIIFR